MTRYACSNPACPPRDPVTADAAPTCYTCGGVMAAVVGRTHAAGWLGANPTTGRLVPLPGVRSTKTGVPARVHEDDFTASHDATPSIGVNIPEPTPEQRATRTLPGLTITITPPPVDRAPHFEPTRKLLLRRDLDGHAVLFHIVAPQFKRSGSCAELRLEEMVNVQQLGFLVDAVNVQQWAFLVDAHRHNRDLAIELSGVFTSSKARIDGMTNSATPDGSYHVKLIIKAILALEAP